IFATVNIYQPATWPAVRAQWQSVPDAQLLSAQAELRVPADDRRLHVAVTRSRATAAPGETVALDVQATGADGAPVRAELSVAVVDEAIYLLSADLSPDLYQA